MKVYWYIEGNSLDEIFFKYGKTKPTDRWCMFSTLLGAYRHAYSQLLGYEDAEELPDNSSIEDYKRILYDYNFLGNYSEIFEIEVRE